MYVVDAANAAQRAEALTRMRFHVVVAGLNIASLALVWAIHKGFRPYVPDFQGTFVDWLMLARIAEQAAEAYWLAQSDAARGRWRSLYPHLSIWSNLAFAVLVSVLSNTDEAHYIVLLVVPVLTAAFTYSWRGVLSVSGIATALLFFELWLFFVLHPADVPTHRPTEHRFELGTMAIVLPVAGIFVWLLVEQLRREQGALAAAFEEIHVANQRLAQEERLADIGRLASVLSHEIRSPVATIVSAIRVARAKCERGEEPTEFYELATNEAKRLENLTNDLLLFTKPLTLNAQRASAKGVLEYIADILRAVKVEAEPEQLVEIEAAGGEELSIDVAQLQRALLNLALNASAHAHIGTPIVLGVEKERDSWCFYVENSGHAISEEAACRIFEPFYSTRGEGSGLGLPISRRIAELHGGSLDLSINEPGRVRFDLRIPGILKEVFEHG